jgi:hypothetical protein
MLFENADMICTQHYQRQLAAFQILLIFETLIGRDQDVKPVVFRGLQKIAVGNRAQPSSATVLTLCVTRYGRS